jgi:hypothetical protein
MGVVVSLLVLCAAALTALLKPVQSPFAIVHVLDFISGNAYTAVIPAKGGFMRLTGRLKSNSKRDWVETPLL